jgi:hypothetical protein
MFLFYTFFYGHLFYSKCHIFVFMFCKVQHFISTMATDDVIFLVNYGGRFDRQDKCMYVGGKIGVFDETYDLDCLSFIEIERIVKKYGYQPGDLIYYLQPDKSLDDGLVLLTCDDDILRMTEFLKGSIVVVLYTVAFGHGDEEDDEPSDDDEEGERRRNKVINDPYWKSLMSSDDDAWDDGAEPEVGTSTHGNVYGEGDGEDGMDMEDGDDVDGVQRIDDDGVGGDGEEEEDDDDEDENENSEFETINAGGSTHKALACIGQLLDDEEEDDVSSNMARSDVLVSPPASDEKNEVDSRPKSRCVPKVSEFDEGDMGDPKLAVGQTFTGAKQFRQAVRTYTLFRGKDIEFIKNDGNRVIGVCRSRSDGCPWRVYGALVTGEMTFMLKSMNPTHRCTRKYKSSIVTSRWIADRMVHKFRVQPNYPLKALYEDVRRKWNVDVSQSQLYRARKKARQQIEGKRKEQYRRLWDYCATVRKTNRGSCMLMKVERPTLDIPPRFLRLYMSLAACKDGFRAACRPVIGVDGCFLKGHYKGQLLAAVGRDPNDNIYPIAIAVVETECKDSWSWFLETLVGDLGPAPHGLRGWTFISDRQKVCLCIVTHTLVITITIYCMILMC